MGRPVEVYLDVETDRRGRLAVVGFSSSETGLVQLVGEEITPHRLRWWLPRSGRLYTFSGNSFDIPRIWRQLDFDLLERFESWDLCQLCHRRGWYGGQKVVERKVRFRRALEDLDGWAAMHLWRRYRRHGDADALDTLLRYNEEDLQGLMAIKRHLGQRGHLWLA